MTPAIKEHNGKYYDFSTSNKTFLKAARDIHVSSPHVNMPNYIFMLEIKDPSLVGVDPHKVDPKDKLTIGKIQLECMTNIWYFLREVCRIPIQGGSSIPFLAHRANMAQIFLFTQGIDSATYIARQLGKTTSALCIVMWCLLFGTTNSVISFFHYKYEMCVKNLASLKDYIKELPAYLKPPTMIKDPSGNIRKIKDNTKEYTNPINNNTIKVLASATNYSSALLSARGLTTPIILMDEFSYVKFIKTIMNASTPAFRTASESARMNNAPYGRIVVSTPGDPSTQEGRESYELETQMPLWSENLYNMDHDQLSQYVKKNGSQPFIRIEYQYTSLGKSVEWFNEVTFGLDTPTIRRDYLLQRVISSGDSPFDEDDLAWLSDNIQEPIYEISINECVFYWYKHLDTEQIYDPSMPYLIGVDCSGGVGNDNQAITIVNPYNLRVAAEFKSQWLGEFELCQLLRDLIQKYIRNGLLCIERNSVGSAIIDNLMHTNIAHRVYCDSARDIIEASLIRDTNKDSILKKRSEMKKYAGVYTEHTSRQRMMDILERHVHTLKDRLNTKFLVEDIGKLIRKSSGKIEAGEGFHDDSVMSYAVSMYVWYHGNALLKYGVDKSKSNIYNENEGLLVEKSTESQAKISQTIKTMYAMDSHHVDPLYRDREDSPYAEEYEKRQDEQESYKDILSRTIIQSRIEDERLISSGLVKSKETNGETKIPMKRGFLSVQDTISSLYEEDPSYDDPSKPYN